MKLYLHIHTQDRDYTPVKLHLRDAWEEKKHPRGQPGNPGEFAKGSGTTSTKKTTPPKTAKKQTQTPLATRAPRKPKPASPSGIAATEEVKAKVNKAVTDYNNSKKTSTDQETAFRQIGKAVFDHMKIDEEVGFEIAPTNDFTVGNKQYKTGGWFQPSDNAVTMCTNVNPSQLDVLVAHEAMHAKFHAVKKAYDKEADLIDHDTRGGEKWGPDWVMTPEGAIREPYKKDYPIHAALAEGLLANGDKLANDDGLTGYSIAYWEAWKNGKCSTELAVNETLAEMAHCDLEGSLPRLIWYKKSKTYRNLYSAIHDLYPTAVAINHAPEKDPGWNFG